LFGEFDTKREIEAEFQRREAQILKWKAIVRVESNELEEIEDLGMRSNVRSTNSKHSK